MVVGLVYPWILGEVELCVEVFTTVGQDVVVVLELLGQGKHSSIQKYLQLKFLVCAALQSVVCQVDFPPNSLNHMSALLMVLFMLLMLCIPRISLLMTGSIFYNQFFRYIF